MYQTSPIWLLSLTATEIDVLFVDALDRLCQSIQNDVIFGSVYKQRWKDIQNKVKEKRFEDVNSSSNMLVLLSGDLDFVQSTSLQCPSNYTLGLIDRYYKMRRRLPGGSGKWSQLSHSYIGGATSFSTLWYQANFPSVLTLPKGMKRNISHFIHHGIRGRPILPDDQSSFASVKSLLSLSKASDTFWYQTPSSRTGFAARPLDPEELGEIFSFPTSVQLQADMVVSNAPVPLDMLRALLNVALSSLGSSSVVRASAPSLQFSPFSPDPRGTYLPTLDCWLPDSWSTDKQVDTSVKHDDAKANVSLWNSRILLPLVSTTRPAKRIEKLISLLRAFVSRSVSRRIFREFMGVLKTRYSDEFREYYESRAHNYVFPTKIPENWKPMDFGHLHDDKGGQLLSSNYITPYATTESLSFEDILTPGRNIIHAFGRHWLSEESFFSWLGGSSLIFWRWPQEFQFFAVKGWPATPLKPLPSYKPRKQSWDAPTRVLLAKKIAKVIDRGYIKLVPKDSIKSFVDFFAVPKGEDDIRLVYNGTTAGLTESLWAPRFWLPSADTLLRMLHFNFEMVDIDLGEMFLNYPLPEILSEVSGIDFQSIKEELCKALGIESVPDNLVGVWLRTWMGLRNSPEWAARFYYLMEEFVRGNEKCPKNPLAWDTVKLNIIGQPGFNPALPHVIKWKSWLNRPAGDLVSFVDDLRTLGYNQEEAWAIARRVASRIQYMGSQDAPRKRRVDENGPWTGTIFNTKGGEITKTVSETKWEKGQDYVMFLVDTLQGDPKAKLEYKLLEKMRGYFCHLAMTFPILFPYLKGFHLVLSAHQKKRNEEGWKISELEWIGTMEHKISRGLMTREEFDRKLHEDQPKPPKTVQATQRFKKCLEALRRFFTNHKPPKVVVRTSKYFLLVYGFVDAAKSGFGDTYDLGDKVTYRIGVWGADEEDESSNWREFENLVESLEEQGYKGNLKNAVVILATDNQVAETCIYKGNSTSEKLYELIIRLRELEIKYSAIFYITHVSGERMKKQGTDGVSRGRLTEGVSIGQAMSSFCPWHKPPLEVSPLLSSWLESWLGKKFEILEPKDWYIRGHDLWKGQTDSLGFWRWETKPGTFVWNLPPGAANVAIEQLRKARIKRRDSFHVILIPRLCTMDWLRQLYRETDLVFTIPAGVDCWPANCCESLTIAFALPFLPFRPWKLQGTPKLCEMERSLRKVFKDESVASGIVLRKFWKQIRMYYHLPEDTVRRMLYFLSKDHISSEASGV